MMDRRRVAYGCWGELRSALYLTLDGLSDMPSVFGGSWLRRHFLQAAVCCLGIVAS
jgi:hypothetical protein